MNTAKRLILFFVFAFVLQCVIVLLPLFVFPGELPYALMGTFYLPVIEQVGVRFGHADGFQMLAYTLVLCVVYSVFLAPLLMTVWTFLDKNFSNE